jgi:hypothetical protein
VSQSQSAAIPYAKLGVPEALEARVAPTAPVQGRLALARGLVPIAPEAQLGVLYLLATDADAAVSKAARASLNELPTKLLLGIISIKTHPKILEYLADQRPPEGPLDERLAMLRVCNDRTVELIAARAEAGLCEQLCRNHERLLMTPGVFVALHANPACAEVHLNSAEAFLRMQQAMPTVPARRPFLSAIDEDVIEAAPAAPTAPTAPATPAAAPAKAARPAAPAAADPLTPTAPKIDLMAEIEAALRGERSPAFLAAEETGLDMFDLRSITTGAKDTTLGAFEFDFADEADSFSWDLTEESGGSGGEDDGTTKATASIERRIAEMSVGKKIKLAFLGNKEARAILIRDRNRVVAGAVVKSGRLTEQEVSSFAGNKNLDSEVIREIVANKEWTRKYPVKVALVNNPKTPVSEAVAMVSQLQKKDLMMLTRNRNVPSVVGAAAVRLFRTKYRGG